MSDVTFRPAHKDDVASIVAMLADDPLGEQRELLSDPVAPMYLEAFEAIDGDPNNHLIVADVAGAVVGCVQLTFIPGLSHQGAVRAQIEGVRVAGSQRGQGLGQKLITHAIDLSRTQGCDMVQLTSDASRTDAQKFYRRLGFTPSHVGMKLSLR